MIYAQNTSSSLRYEFTKMHDTAEYDNDIKVNCFWLSVCVFFRSNKSFTRVRQSFDDAME